ncbi:MAG: hypothetical protein EHM64_11060 [Ignavibacteriae bacterium]|nr:MAG: hypothetical protein EHM64_11060 [Ignavibacteriota bacterium]
MKYICIIIISAFVATSCVVESSKDIYDYSIDQAISCFCPPTGTVRLFVRADTIADALSLSDNNHIERSQWTRYKTIKGLFDVIAQRDTSRFDVKVTMDPKDNYPSRIFINPKPVIVDSIAVIITDGGFAYETSNYVRLK